MAELRFEISTALAANVDEVWAHASTMEGVNAELGPWVRMTVPRRARGKRLSDVQLGRWLFTARHAKLRTLRWSALPAAPVHGNSESTPVEPRA